MRKIFLACPYGHDDAAVVEGRFDLANGVAAKIVQAGATVFSQVSMSHPINKALSGLDRQAVGRLWAPIDEHFMDVMEELIVVDAPGWREISGIKREIAYFESRGRKISLWSEVEREFAAA